MPRTSLHRRSPVEPTPKDLVPVPTGWYHVLVQEGQLRVTRSGTYVIRLDLQIVTPREYFGRRLYDVIVPLEGEAGLVAQARGVGYGLPQFIIEDYLGGGLMPVGNEAGLALVAAELTGRTAYVRVRRGPDLVRGGERSFVMHTTQQKPESAAV